VNRGARELAFSRFLPCSASLGPLPSGRAELLFAAIAAWLVPTWGGIYTAALVPGSSNLAQNPGRARGRDVFPAYALSGADHGSAAPVRPCRRFFDSPWCSCWVAGGRYGVAIELVASGPPAGRPAARLGEAPFPSSLGGCLLRCCQRASMPARVFRRPPPTRRSQKPSVPSPQNTVSLLGAVIPESTRFQNQKNNTS